MPAAPLAVLVVDDEPALREVLSLRLASWGHQVVAAGDATEADAVLREQRVDLVLSDVVLPGLSGLDLLRVFKARNATMPVVLMTAHGTVDTAVEAMKDGAMDFLTKPIDTEALRALLDTVGHERQLRERNAALDAVLDASADPMSGVETDDGLASGLVGRSAAMRAVRRLIAQLASSDASVLITGESGTGKELAAHAIHARSARAEGPFVAINAAAIPDGLIESEIFGHEAGAFTGAARARAGSFEQANGGTLFLDELAEMPLALQPKLLRLLEDGRVRRLGGSTETAFDVRVLAATNREPMRSVEEGRLRADLLYRLNVFEIVMPALRDRLDDLPLLVRHFLRQFNTRHHSTVDGLRPAALEQLSAWHWPGNVRELRNVLERAVILARSGWVELAHLPPYLTSPAAAASRPIQLPSGATLADAERMLVLTTLERCGQNKSEAARRLGVDVKTLRNKLKAWGTLS